MRKALTLALIALVGFAHADDELTVEDLTDNLGATGCCQSLSGRGHETFTFHQNSGKFTGPGINTRAYSGNGAGKLNPAKQCVRNVGVLPAATYKLSAC